VCVSHSSYLACHVDHIAMQLDPLPEGFHKASSLMPVMRRPSNGENNMMTSTEPTQGVQSSEKKDGNNISSGGTVGPSDSEQVHSSKEETPGAKDQNGDRVPLLGLPAPQNDLTVWERAVGIINDILERRTEVPRVRWRMFCIDMAKSIILVTKASHSKSIKFSKLILSLGIDSGISLPRRLSWSRDRDVLRVDHCD
jgi:hypothetical protein